MAKAMKSEQRDEWDTVYREAYELAEFFEMTHPGILRPIEAAREPYQPFRMALAGLREARNDLLTMSGLASGSIQRRLDAHVRARLGRSLDDLQQKRMQRLNELRTRGHLTTDEQFRMVLTRLDQISGDPEFAEESEALTRLVVQYESRVKRRTDSKMSGNTPSS